MLDPRPRTWVACVPAPTEGGRWAGNRTIFLGLDQFRDELPGSNIKGKNPLKDVRVRKALYQAIDADTISRNIMRGLGKAHQGLVAPQVAGWTEGVAKRFPTWRRPRSCWPMRATPAASRWTLPAPTTATSTTKPSCQAVTAMWARIGVKAKLRTMPLVNYFPHDPALRGQHLHAGLGRAHV